MKTNNNAIIEWIGRKKNCPRCTVTYYEDELEDDGSGWKVCPECFDERNDKEKIND